MAECRYRRTAGQVPVNPPLTPRQSGDPDVSLWLVQERVQITRTTSLRVVTAEHSCDVGPRAAATATFDAFRRLAHRHVPATSAVWGEASRHGWR